MAPPSSSWRGLDSVKYLMVFGDSYSQTVYPGEQQPKPTDTEPLGIKFPGTTFNEDDVPNWIGHLVKKTSSNPLLVWNYAEGGAAIEDVKAQVERFIRNMPDRFTSASPAELEGSVQADQFKNTLFVVWVGINDCCRKIDPRERVSEMFQSCITPLYNAGAQNLLVIDVPPRIRPSGEPNPSLAYTQHHWKIKMWNKTIHRKIEDMQVEHPDICIMTFSAWDLFTDIYDNPEKYGFKAEDVDQAYGGKMWMDGLHPTSAVHSIIADHVHSMLSTKDASDV